MAPCRVDVTLTNTGGGNTSSKLMEEDPVEPEDQAEAILLLLSDRLAKTTGHVIPVDGGLADGFLR